MASAAKTSRVETVVFGVVTAVLIALLLGGWASKESTVAHAADMRAVKDSLSFKLDQLKDIICEDKPRSRRCR